MIFDFIDIYSDVFILGNSLRDYIAAFLNFLLIFFIIFLISRLFFYKMTSYFKKEHPAIIDDGLILMRKYVIPLFYLGGFYYVISGLNIKENIRLIFDTFFVVIFVITAINLFKRIIIIWLNKKAIEKNEPLLNPAMIAPVVNIILWVLGSIFILDNLGFKVSSIITGLGIGGIAVAMASQNILGDIISYISMIFDKPFVIGDFIIIGDYLGNVEKIGIRTTRIKSLSGEQLIFSNSDIIKSRIKNYKKMAERRIVFTVSLTYGTSKENIIKACNFIKDAVISIPGTRFDRAHFKTFGSSSLDIEVVYFVLTGDFNNYMDIQQDINIKVYEFFNENNIQFALPTQTIHINN